jgi:glycosyltransferase involved in cell wall biosynthesis
MAVDDMEACGGRRLHENTAYNVQEVPLVTVITAVFNGVSTIKRCIQSVVDQDYPYVEHIIVDGGSTDGTIDVLREYENRIAIWISEPDHGVYDAWNKGLRLARGEWIAFLGSDDEYLPGAITAYMALASDNLGADYLSSQVKWLHSSGYSRIIGGPWEWRRFSRYMCCAHVGSMHRRRLFERYGYLDVSYRIAADYEFLLRARAELHSAFVPTVTVHMRAGGASDSIAALREAKRAKLETGGLPKLVAVLDLRLAIIKYQARTRFLKVFRWMRLTRDVIP